MTNRATRVLCAVLTGFVASTSIAVDSLRAEGASGKCYLFKPDIAPPGQHWAPSIEPLTNRRCWLLRKVETPSQARESIPLPVARAAVRTPATTPTRPAERTAPDASATRAELPAQPPVKQDGNGTAANAPAPPPAAELAEQNPPNVEPPAAELRLLAPRAPDPALVLLSRAPATPASTSQTQDTKQETRQEAKQEAQQETKQEPRIEASEAPVAAAAETTEETHAIHAPDALQMFLLAIFCGPALYLVVTSAIRRVARAGRRSRRYASLHGAPAELALLPPRLESNENAVAS
jgi:hypothetical protein